MKIVHNVLLILISGFFLVGCGDKSPQTTTDEDPPIVEAPSIIISLEDAEQLFKNYGDRRVPLIEQDQNVDENGEAIDPESEAYIQATRSLSLNYAELQQYMAFIEQQAANAKTDITGLRIYFGLYDSKGTYPNAETVFLNPLMEYGKKGDIKDDVAFAIQDVGGTPTGVAVGEILGTFKPVNVKGGTNLEMVVQGDVQSLAGNRMPRRPPPPPPNDPDY